MRDSLTWKYDGKGGCTFGGVMSVFYWLACQVQATLGNSGLCCVYATYFRCWLTHCVSWHQFQSGLKRGLVFWSRNHLLGMYKGDRFGERKKVIWKDIRASVVLAFSASVTFVAVITFSPQGPRWIWWSFPLWTQPPGDWHCAPKGWWKMRRSLQQKN